MEGRILLIADDDDDDKQLFTEALNKVDPSAICYSAVNGEEVFKLLRSEVLIPEVILLDLNMPVMSGWDCLRLLKEDRLFKHIPVIIYTTSDSEKDVERAKVLGAEMLITKPASFKEIQKLVRSVLHLIKVGKI